MPLKNANVGKHCYKCRKRKALDGLRNEKEGGTEACTHPALDSTGKGQRKAQVRAGRREAGLGTARQTVAGGKRRCLQLNEAGPNVQARGCTERQFPGRPQLPAALAYCHDGPGRPVAGYWSVCGQHGARTDKAVCASICQSG